MSTKKPRERIDEIQRDKLDEAQGILIGFGFSCLFWLFAVVIPLWLHYHLGRGK